MKYYLLDTKRTAHFKKATWWKRGQNGYTTKLSEAEVFPEATAKNKCDNSHKSNAYLCLDVDQLLKNDEIQISDLEKLTPVFKHQ